MSDTSNYAFFIPEEYKGKLFLDVTDIQNIFCLGENKVYDFLKDSPPFKVIKIGNQYRVPAMPFWKWYSE